MLTCLLGCAPSPEVVQAGAGHEIWNPSATKTPPRPDADDSVDPPPGTGGAPGDPEVDADVPPAPDADDRVPVTDAAVTVRPDAGARDLPPATTGPGQRCTLTFQVTTVTFGGSYSPRNIGAIWISDAAGRFVKSLTVWAGRRIRHLETWEAVSMGNTVDAVTSATAGSHGTRTGKWDCTGVDHQPVASGAYRLNVEFTERNSEGKLMTPLGFNTGGSVNLMPADQSNFKTIRLQMSTP